MSKAKDKAARDKALKAPTPAEPTQDKVAQVAPCPACGSTQPPYQVKAEGQPVDRCPGCFQPR